MSRGAATGGPATKLAKLPAPRKNDITVLKPRHSAFCGSPLEILLEAIGVRALVIVGFAGGICVQLTAMDAFVRGFKLRVPRDCVASETPAKNEVALAYMAYMAYMADIL
jgi:nicotinamidase-related amidase